MYIKTFLLHSFVFLPTSLEVKEKRPPMRSGNSLKTTKDTAVSNTYSAYVRRDIDESRSLSPTRTGKGAKIHVCRALPRLEEEIYIDSFSYLVLSQIVHTSGMEDEEKVRHHSLKIVKIYRKS